MSEQNVWWYVELVFFVFNDTATTEIYTLSLHDALPIYLEGEPVHAAHVQRDGGGLHDRPPGPGVGHPEQHLVQLDRKSTRLNSSHANISYAVFCLQTKHKLYLRSTRP